jgi:hypothetical protein
MPNLRTAIWRMAGGGIEERISRQFWTKGITCSLEIINLCSVVETKVSKSILVATSCSVLIIIDWL